MTLARPRLAAALLLTIGAGLASRRWPLPGLLAEHTGDALYATAAWFALALVWPRARFAALAGAAFAAAALVEVSQRFHPPWLDRLRADPWLRLLLGGGFQWQDLAAYAVGALLPWPLRRWLAPPVRDRDPGPP